MPKRALLTPRHERDGAHEYEDHAQAGESLTSSSSLPMEGVSDDAMQKLLQLHDDLIRSVKKEKNKTLFWRNHAIRRYTPFPLDLPTTKKKLLTSAMVALD